ncbi:MAG: hypothetical protein R3E32_08845 [Chitinophagales bacterium]
MLLNLSNHPYPNWNKHQHQTAVQQYGEIQDIPFPNIPPEFAPQQVAELADVYLQKIQKLQLDHPQLTVHLMGELTFTFTLVLLLQKQGIEVVASTSERLTTTNEDGTKNIRFEFVRFRKYAHY